jgi:hypothetical protein
MFWYTMGAVPHQTPHDGTSLAETVQAGRFSVPPGAEPVAVLDADDGAEEEPAAVLDDAAALVVLAVEVLAVLVGAEEDDGGGLTVLLEEELVVGDERLRCRIGGLLVELRDVNCANPSVSVDVTARSTADWPCAAFVTSKDTVVVAREVVVEARTAPTAGAFCPVTFSGQDDEATAWALRPPLR